jgi:hypothetical protein
MLSPVRENAIVCPSGIQTIQLLYMGNPARFHRPAVSAPDILLDLVICCHRSPP